MSGGKKPKEARSRTVCAPRAVVPRAAPRAIAGRGPATGEGRRPRLSGDVTDLQGRGDRGAAGQKPAGRARGLLCAVAKVRGQRLR